MEELKLVLNNVEKVAVEAGKILLHHFGKIRIDDIEVKSKNDYVTFVDKESENLIMTQLQKLYPEIGFLAEEIGSRDSGSEEESSYLWVIDPLDGTKNYIHGYPLFAISIALEYAGEPILGLVYDPMHNEFFKAIKGQGAQLNNRPITVSSIPYLQYALIATGFPHRKHQMIDKYLQDFKNVFLHTSGIRRDGSAALNLCYTACGRFDGFWEYGLGRWDISAASLILKEAGGVVKDIDGSDNYLNTGNIIGANPRIFDEFSKLLC